MSAAGHRAGATLMKWEELIAEARAAGVLKFCADGIAVLQQAQVPRVAPPIGKLSPGEDRQCEARNKNSTCARADLAQISTQQRG
jgi:hypothetical protein